VALRQTHKYLPPFDIEIEVIASVFSAAKRSLYSNLLKRLLTWEECLLLIINPVLYHVVASNIKQVSIIDQKQSLLDLLRNSKELSKQK
jgi:hypothetical protein